MNKTIITLLLITTAVLLVGCGSKVDYEQAYNLELAKTTACRAEVTTLSSQELICAETECPTPTSGCNATDVLELMDPDIDCMLALKKAEKRIERMEELNSTLSCMNTDDDLTNCELKLNRTQSKIADIKALID